MRISDWSSDVCSSDLIFMLFHVAAQTLSPHILAGVGFEHRDDGFALLIGDRIERLVGVLDGADRLDDRVGRRKGVEPHRALRSEEHTSELQSLMRISYAVFCLKKKKS